MVILEFSGEIYRNGAIWQGPAPVWSNTVEGSGAKGIYITDTDNAVAIGKDDITSGGYMLETSGNVLFENNLDVNDDISAGKLIIDNTIRINDRTIEAFDASGHVVIGGTTGLVIPSGDTDNNRTVTQIGMIRYNTQTSTFEGCDGDNWGVTRWCYGY